MTASKISPGLLKERKTANFNVNEFAVWFSGGENNYKEKRRLEKIFFEDPEFIDETPCFYLSFKELHERAIRLISKVTPKFYNEVIKPELSKNQNEWDMLRTIRNVHATFIAVGLGKFGSPDHVHYGLFLPTILSQGTKEQKLKWFTKALKLQIIGTYVQTELGHGTYIKGLETVAEYDPKSQQFVLNTPSLTAYKWWPGGLGHTVNHAIVMANLVSGGKSYGVQPFLVQLRDEETHMPLPGIDIGDIGPKMGLNSLNNGYLGFKNVRINRDQMMMNNAEVLPNGDFRSSPKSALSYGASMLFVRLGVVNDAPFQLMCSAIIATRYSAVRRQSPIEVNEPEPQIMDHLTQQAKLFPQIAKSLVYKLISEYTWQTYRQVMTETSTGNVENLPDLHAITCGLKAVLSNDAMKGFEILRLACGGHGYSEFSNLPNFYTGGSAMSTYDGENTIMLLQTYKHLYKSWGKLVQGKEISKQLQYLKYAVDKTREPLQHWGGCVMALIDVLEYTAAHKVRLTYERIENEKKKGNSKEKAFSLCGIHMVRSADWHTRAFIAKVAFEIINAQKVSATLSNLLKDIFEIFVLDTFLQNMGDILQFIPFTENDCSAVQACFERALLKFRPNAIGVVDGFEVHDELLNSALGSYDGNVYERIFEMVKKNPINHEPVNKSFHLYLKPFMKSNL